MDLGTPRPERFFWWITSAPRAVLCGSVALALSFGAFLPSLTRDTRPVAFIAQDHPDLLYWEEIREQFSNGWTLHLAVLNDGAAGVFDAGTLRLVDELTNRIEVIDGVVSGRVTSLTNAQVPSADGTSLERLIPMLPATFEEARALRRQVSARSGHPETLLAPDGTGTVILIQLDGDDSVFPAYQAIERLVAEVHRPNGEEIHLAGAAAVDAWLGNYIDSDFRSLSLVSLLVIFAILLLSYRTVRGCLIPVLLTVCTVVASFGAMAAAGVPFFVLTTALVVLLTGLAISDVVHILGQYYTERARDPGASARTLTVRAMTRIWRPIWFTSLTSAAGFVCLGITSFLPPMRALGIFSTVGIAVAFGLSITAVPAVLTLLPPSGSPAFPKQLRGGLRGGDETDVFGRMVATLGSLAVERPRWTWAIVAVFVAVGTVGATRMTIDGIFVEVFHPDEPIRIADRIVSERLSGAVTVDVVFRSVDGGSLATESALQEIASIQQRIRGLEHVNATKSFVDLITTGKSRNGDRDLDPGLDSSQISRRLSAWQAESPEELGGWITPDRSQTNLRVYIESGLATVERAVTEPIEALLAERLSAESGIEARVAGRGALHGAWVLGLARGHFLGVALAFLTVFLASAASFRSMTAGALTVAPVCVSVLFVYGVIGHFDIWLNAPSSMTAAIGFGTGVDFSLHFLSRWRAIVRDRGLELGEALPKVFPSTGRSLLFGAATVALGFGVLRLSDIPTMSNFGLLIFVAATTSFVFTMTALPLLVLALRPRFMKQATRAQRSMRQPASAISTMPG